jgi:hypothetical protein
VTIHRLTEEDSVGLLAEQRRILTESIDFRPLPVDPLIEHRSIAAAPGNEAGRVDVVSCSAESVERFTTYRFHRADTLTEHLCHVWPGPGWEFPALTTVLFELPEVCIVGADFVPVGDVAFDRTYYGRYLLGFADVVQRHWPALIAHRIGPEPPPSPYFTLQVGSAAGVLAYLSPAAIPAVIDFLCDVTTAWAQMHDGAQPAPPDRAARVEERRLAVMKQAYKGLDYHSPAGDGLASVLGWEGANRMFDAVFGPDDPPQPTDRRRRYLEVDQTPGSPPPRPGD